MLAPSHIRGLYYSHGRESVLSRKNKSREPAAKRASAIVPSTKTRGESKKDLETAEWEAQKELCVAFKAR